MIHLTQFAQSYDNTYYYAGGGDAATGDISTGLVFLAIIFIFLAAVAAYAVQSFLLGRIFAKAHQPSWKAWVPIYNQWILLELGGQKGYWAVFGLIPIVNLVSAVFSYIAMYHIGLRLGKSETFVLWAIFLPLVWMIWLAVDDSKWHDKEPHANQAKKTAQ